MTMKPIGTVKDLVVLFQVHVVLMCFLIVDIGEFGRKTVIFGKLFLAATGANVNINAGVINFNLETNCGNHRLYRKLDLTVDGKPFNFAATFFFKDLAHLGSDQAWVLGLFIRDLDKARIDKLYISMKKHRDKMKLLDEVGLSTRPRTAYAIGDNGAGTSKSSRSNEGDKAFPPNEFEIDPGDIPNANLICPIFIIF